MKLFFAFLALFLAATTTALAQQDQLVADLDREEVRITTGFDGAELLLFGALEMKNHDDIVIIVSGPEKPVTMHRKNRILGIWINTESATLTDVPSFYHIFATRPIDMIADSVLRSGLRLGYEHIPFALAPGSRIDEGEEREWRAALARNMEAEGLWGVDENKDIEAIQSVLFRTDVALPANVHPGWYEVRILHFRSNRLVTEDISAIEVVKSGVSAEIYGFAHNYAPFYGIFAILFAGIAGWAAAVAFRR